MRLEFLPWPRFRAFRDRAQTRKWLKSVAAEGRAAFASGMRNGPHTGRVYRRRGGRLHQASAPGEFPAKDTGRLLASLKSHTGKDEAVIGTNMFYSKFLREGTRKMARRRMSDDALQLGIDASRKTSKGWVKWLKTKQNR